MNSPKKIIPRGAVKTARTATAMPRDQLLVGDCLSVMAGLPDASVDLVFADPPYNLQLNGSVLTRPDHSRVEGVCHDWDKFSSLAAYDQFTTAWLAEARRVLKPDGSLWVIGSYHNIYRVGALLQNAGFWILNDIIWRKTNPMPNFRGRRFTNAHETLIWAARSEKSRHVFQYDAMKMLNDDVQMRSDWLLPVCHGNERLKHDGKTAHPTQKPEALLARVILASTQVSDIILDPFFGTGTSGVVAKKLHRHWIGIEQDKTYAKLAQDRIDATQPLEDASLLAEPARRTAPRIPFGNLIEQGMIRPGDKLSDASGKIAARVRADGSLIEIRKQPSNTTTVASGSIHSLGARLQGRESCNGWTYWHIRRNGRMIPIDRLREDLRGRLNENGDTTASL